MKTLNRKSDTVRGRVPRRLAGMLLLAMLLPVASAAWGQNWGTPAGLLQGEHLARSGKVYDDTLRATADTTAWIPFGTHAAALAGERVYAPGRFTLFVLVDTTGVPHAAGPEITLRAELALDDTTSMPYEQWDGSLLLAPDTNPIRSAAGLVIPVPVYGGGWLRFIVGSADTARVRLDLWRTW